MKNKLIATMLLLTVQVNGMEEVSIATATVPKELKRKKIPKFY